MQFHTKISPDIPFFLSMVSLLVSKFVCPYTNTLKRWLVCILLLCFYILLRLIFYFPVFYVYLELISICIPLLRAHSMVMTRTLAYFFILHRLRIKHVYMIYLPSLTYVIRAFLHFQRSFCLSLFGNVFFYFSFVCSHVHFRI